ncbi:Na+:solute symporter [Streptomyces sp. NBC_01283]|uniref:solute symporter family protein n=1 Tax=Streptomyces sp. NBC_01283 TaxID=2903812 RepID=UPI00352EF0B5|nr:Na+:solute symporter [Streptomyces sp. NBC_01283]
MSSTIFLADPPPPVDNTWAAPAVAIPLTIAVAVLVFFLVKAVGRRTSGPDGFLLDDRKIGPGQNAVALASAPIMYSTMFIITGHIALSGYDAVLLLTAFTMSMMLGVLIFASPMRNLGVRTLGDLFALRARERPARIASAVVILLIYTMFTIISMAAVAFIFNRWFGLDALVVLALMVAVVGLVTVLYVYVGGMAGVTRILVFKAALAFAVVAVLTTLVLAKFNMNPLSLLEEAEANAVAHKAGYDLLGPGRLFGEGSDRWIHLSKLFCIVVGVAAIPFLFMRNFAVTSGQDARKSAGWASMMVVAFYLCMSVVGLGAVAVLGGENIGVIKPHRDISLPKLADDLGGPLMVGVLAVIALLTIVGVFAALLINAVTAVTRDINVVRGRRLDPVAELRDIRRNVKIIGIASVVGGVAMLPVRTHIFIPTSIDVAGAAVLPAVVYALFWRRFNTSGLLWTVYGGIAVTMFMVVFSNGVSAEEDAIFPGADFKFVDIEPGMISVPVAFLLGYIGTLLSKERNDAGFAELQVRALTGAAAPSREEAPPSGVTVKSDPESRTPSEAH